MFLVQKILGNGTDNICTSVSTCPEIINLQEKVDNLNIYFTNKIEYLEEEIKNLKGIYLTQHFNKINFTRF